MHSTRPAEGGARSASVLSGVEALTMLEVLATILIASVALGGMLLTFTNYLMINDSAQALNLATNMAVKKAEEIRHVAMTDFSQVYPRYVNPIVNKTFTVDGLSAATAIGSYSAGPNDPNANLYTITISVCWQERGGRVLRGEDANLDGSFDSGSEDVDGDGVLDAPVQLSFAIARR